MIQFIKLTIGCFVFLLLFSKCTETTPLPKGRYDYDSRGKYLKGKLSDSSFQALKTYLQQSFSGELKDTIIIKYDFNSADCRGGLHDENDTAVLNRIQFYQKGVAEQVLKRPGISVFEFREAGNTISKYRRWNQDVKIDNGFLQRLFFTEKTICGTSVIMLPDHQFLVVKTDPHFDALYHLSQKDILDGIFHPKRSGN